jgi:hypothetical protein
VHWQLTFDIAELHETGSTIHGGAGCGGQVITEPSALAKEVRVK